MGSESAKIEVRVLKQNKGVDLTANLPKQTTEPQAVNTNITDTNTSDPTSLLELQDSQQQSDLTETNISATAAENISEISEIEEKVTAYPNKELSAEGSVSEDLPESDQQNKNVSDSEATKTQSDNEIEELISQLLDYFLAVMNIDADVYILDDKVKGVMVFEIEGDSVGLLIGHRGETVRALQFLIKILVRQKLHKIPKFVIDISGYHDRSINTIKDIAFRAAEKAITYNQPVVLEPMPPEHRKIIHTHLLKDKRVITQSTEHGRMRRVVIKPKFN